jgi:hypothetical protein
MAYRLGSVLEFLRNLLQGYKPPDNGPYADSDPYAGSPVRNSRDPSGRGAMVAVAEPDDDE